MQDEEYGQSVVTKENRARPEIIALAAIAIAVGIFTRFVTRSSLWLDEALSVNIASAPLGQLVEHLKHDGHPPFYYLVLHGWTGVFGSGDLWVRGLSGLFGLLTLPLVWVIGRRKGGPTLGWVAVAVVAVSPFAVRYSNEARMYSLVMLLVVIGWLLIDDVIDRGKATLPRFFGIAVVGAVLLYTHYWSLWLLGAIGLTALWKMGRAPDSAARRPWLGLVLALVAAGIAFAPWLPTMIYQAAHTGTPWAKASRPTAALGVMLADYGGGAYAEQSLGAAMIGVALVIGVFGFTIDRRTTGLDLRTRREFRGPAWIASFTFLVGCAVSFLGHSAFASRYTAVLFPLIALLVAAGICCFESRWVRFVVVTGMCLVLSVGAFWNVVYHRTQLKAVAGAVSSSATPGDIVVFCPDQLGPAGVRVMPSDLMFISYPSYDDGRFVDWVDYADRNRSSDPAAFASRVLADAGPSHAIYVVWSDSYKTLEGKCSGLIEALSASRQPQQLVGADGERYFEHASLTRFAPPK
ncbi:MAG: glycosyltransferase family 39 protein [Actinomycetota bacterium]